MCPKFLHENRECAAGWTHIAHQTEPNLRFWPNLETQLLGLSTFPLLTPAPAELGHLGLCRCTFELFGFLDNRSNLALLMQPYVSSQARWKRTNLSVSCEPGSADAAQGSHSKD